MLLSQQPNTSIQCASAMFHTCVLLWALLCVSVWSVCASVSDHSDQSGPHLVGAKLVGVFHDSDHDSGHTSHSSTAHKYSAQAQSPPNQTTTTKTPPLRHVTVRKVIRLQSHVNRKHLHYCAHNVFEAGAMEAVATAKPECVLGVDYNDVDFDTDHNQHNQRNQRNHTRRRRAVTISPAVNTAVHTHLPAYFRVPEHTGQKEHIADDSYIKLSVKVCAQPGAEVLLFDVNSERILAKFRNGGTAQQCNRWTGDFEQAISDSSSVQVEYRLPIGHDLALQSSATYQYLTATNDQGYRTIEFRSDTDAVFTLDLRYTEVPFVYEDGSDKPQVLEATADGSRSDPIEVQYRPNWIKTFVLGRRSNCAVEPQAVDCENRFLVGLSVEIEELNLDFDRGDYLLVGPGDQPEFWKGSKGHMIAQKIRQQNGPQQTQQHRIWINADSAYIRLVTHNSLIDRGSNDTPAALRFRWTPGNDVVNEVPLGEVSSQLKDASLQLCLVGYECKYYSTVDTLFVDEAVHLFNQYLIEHDKGVNTLIDRDSVQIFDMEPIYYSKGHFSEQYCQFHLALSSPYDSDYPLVTAEVLREMFFEGGVTSRKMINQQVVVNNCVFQRISWLTILMPILVIALLSTGFVLLFWRMQNRMFQANQSFKVQNRESLQQLRQEHRDTDAGLY